MLPTFNPIAMITCRQVPQGLCLLSMLLLLGSQDAFSQALHDQTRPGAFHVEHTTLHNAGFEWRISGDVNRNATVAVSFRKAGTSPWQEGHPLLRIGGETLYGHGQRWGHTTPHMFAGSLFDLEANTDYECRFVMSDPDGIEGNAEHRVVIRTRAEPQPYAHGQVYHVYPPGYEGQKEEPAFTGLNEAYYGGGNLGDWWLVPEPRVRPGDVLLVHAGVYN